ncbi:hypothetical protein EDB85DRAFT_2020258 [Lactarius pseudohatsudake]|nr:hypothetical protein EDB85DRAFT_2020258 [Lactarius pseudohatsudake]
MSRQRQSVCRQRRRARPATTSQRQLRNLRHDSFGRHAVPPFRVQKASSSLWCGRGSIDMWACDHTLREAGCLPTYHATAPSLVDSPNPTMRINMRIIGCTYPSIIVYVVRRYMHLVPGAEVYCKVPSRSSGVVFRVPTCRPASDCDCDPYTTILELFPHKMGPYMSFCDLPCSSVTP